MDGIGNSVITSIIIIIIIIIVIIVIIIIKWSLIVNTIYYIVIWYIHAMTSRKSCCLNKLKSWNHVSFLREKEKVTFYHHLIMPWHVLGKQQARYVPWSIDDKMSCSQDIWLCKLIHHLEGYFFPQPIKWIPCIVTKSILITSLNSEGSKCGSCHFQPRGWRRTKIIIITTTEITVKEFLFFYFTSNPSLFIKLKRMLSTVALKRKTFEDSQHYLNMENWNDVNFIFIFRGEPSLHSFQGRCHHPSCKVSHYLQ
jgi:hypothetical protein